jgi:D-glycero-D-manno-heptose 1,7-bisphosphate phosphatase
LSPAPGSRPPRAAVFLDRDGTLVDELGFLTRAADLRLLPGAAAGVRALNQAGLAVVLVTNQSGIARGLLSEADLAAIHARLARELAGAGAHLDALYHCPHHPQQGQPPLRRACSCRKPEPGLLFAAAREHGLDLARSWVVGDGARDLEAGRRAGVPGRVLVLTGKGRETLAGLAPLERARTLIAADLCEAVRQVLAQGR